MVYGCFVKDEYGQDLGFGYYRTDTTRGTFLDTNGNITILDSDYSQDLEWIHVTRTSADLSVEFSDGTI